MAAAWITVVSCRKAVPLRLTVTVMVSAFVSDRVMVACPELFVVTLAGVEKVAEPVVLKMTAALGITLPYWSFSVSVPVKLTPATSGVGNIKVDVAVLAAAGVMLKLLLVTASGDKIAVLAVAVRVSPVPTSLTLRLAKLAAPVVAVLCGVVPLRVAPVGELVSVMAIGAPGMSLRP